MKKVTLTALTWMGLLLATGGAHAYECKSSDGASILTVQKQQMNRFGDISIVLTSGTQTTQYFGMAHSEGGVLLGKQVIDLYPFQGDTLTIVSMPKSCGRALCDVKAPPIVTANLQIGETSAFFFCDETTH